MVWEDSVHHGEESLMEHNSWKKKTEDLLPTRSSLQEFSDPLKIAPPAGGLGFNRWTCGDHFLLKPSLIIKAEYYLSYVHHHVSSDQEEKS
jgi:hypothetical protein